MGKTTAYEKLRSISQQHLLDYYDQLDEPRQENLLAQIEGLNIPAFRLQQQMLLGTAHPPLQFLDPFHDSSQAGNPEEIEEGKRLITEGKVGCVLVAGGQGTRLRLDGPKGAYPVSLIKKKSLFRLFAEKVIAAGKQANRLLQLAIMTSPENHQETLQFFENNLFFGLDPSQLKFFCQGALPLLDHKGNLFLNRPDSIADGPDGNGSSLRHFVTSGIWEHWYGQGVRYLNFVLIDNPLADPFDPNLTGHHYRQGADVIVKSAHRRDAEEKVGVLVKHEDKVKVIEYTELSEKERNATAPDGKLLYCCANLGLFSFAMDFVKKASRATLPLHLAHKAVDYLSPEGKTLRAEEPNAWKFEEFIFDTLSLALKVNALLYPRESCFAPLKNAQGEDSLATVQAALQERDRQIYKNISGIEAPDRPFELSQAFYYPTPKLTIKWTGRLLPDEGYIEP